MVTKILNELVEFCDGLKMVKEIFQGNVYGTHPNKIYNQSGGIQQSALSENSKVGSNQMEKTQNRTSMESKTSISIPCMNPVMV